MSEIIVRPTAIPAEHNLLFWIADQEFDTEPSQAAAAEWQHYVENMEEFRPEQRRAAFRDDILVGSYLIYERTMHVGTAAIMTGCIGAVVTRPEYRRQGIATHLLNDAIDFARSRGHGLLLLEGIPHFYHQFGFVDVFDVSEVVIALAAIRTTDLATYQTRPATADDAQALQDLYQHHFSTYTGSFSRTLRQQQQRLARRLQGDSPNPPMVVTDAAGTVTGAMLLNHKDHPCDGFDVMADDWESVRALLQYHANLLATSDATEIVWRIPLDSPLSMLLADHLKLPDYIPGTDPQRLYAVRSQTYHFSNAAWMARLVSFQVVTATMVSVWQQRWRESLVQWQGALTLQVDADQVTFVITGTTVTVSDTAASDSLVVTITAATFIQLLFGYRSVTWARQQAGNSIPVAAVAPLTILFPNGHTWIPASDGF